MRVPGFSTLRGLSPRKAALLGTPAVLLATGVLLALRSGSDHPRGDYAAMYLPAEAKMSPKVDSSAYDTAEAKPPLASDPRLAQEAMAASQRLIRSGTFTLEVAAFDRALGQAQAIAGDCGGYLVDLQARRQDGGPASGTLSLRVRPDRYFEAVARIRGLGKVEQEGVSTQDVTRQYADLESRLGNKRELQARMREILRTRATRMEDLLAAEQQLSAVTEEIERMEGERRYYQQMTGLSTLTLELHEPALASKAAAKKPGLFAPVVESAQASLASLVAFLAWLVSALVFLLPWALLGGLAWALGRRFLRFLPSRP